MGKELFKNIPSKVEDLVKGVRNGRIGLLQMLNSALMLRLSRKIQTGTICG